MLTYPVSETGWRQYDLSGRKNTSAARQLADTKKDKGTLR